MFNYTQETKGLATQSSVNQLQVAIDNLRKGFENYDVEQVSNQQAHKRMQESINEVRKEVGMDTVPVV
jgi:hypothetical protein